MYERYWDLACRPFENHFSSPFFFHGETHESALLKLRDQVLPAAFGNVAGVSYAVSGNTAGNYDDIASLDMRTPIVLAVRSNGAAVPMTYPLFRLVVLAAAIVIGIGLWLVLNRTRIGMMIRAGVDDRAMLAAAGVNVHVVFAIVFAIGAGLAGFAGVIGGTALSIAPGEDVRYLLASLVVVIVGGMGSITGAAIGALLIGLAEQIGLAYFPTYGVVLTFVIMVAVLAFRPQGIMGQLA